MAARREGRQFNDNNALERPTGRKGPIGILAEFPRLPNPSEAGRSNENAAAAGPRDGAQDAFEARQLLSDYTRKRRPNAMSLFAEKAHKRISRMVGYALTLGTYEAWADASLVFRAHLTAEERAALAWSAVNALDTHEAELVLGALRKGRAG